MFLKWRALGPFLLNQFVLKCYKNSKHLFLCRRIWCHLNQMCLKSSLLSFSIHSPSSSTSPHTNTDWTNHQAFGGWGALGLCCLLGPRVFNQERNVLMWSLTGCTSSKLTSTGTGKKTQWLINNAMMRIPGWTSQSQKTNSLICHVCPRARQQEALRGLINATRQDLPSPTCLAIYFTVLQILPRKEKNN